MPFKDIYQNFLNRFLFRNTSNIKNLFDHHFFDQKYFLQPSASEIDFAKLLNVSTEILNHISKTYYLNSFVNLIEEYRYMHFIKEFENPLNADLPLDSIIKLSGFEDNNRFADFVKNKSNFSINKLNNI